MELRGPTKRSDPVGKRTEDVSHDSQDLTSVGQHDLQINAFISEFVYTNIGIPKGTTLGLFLFLIQLC